MGSNIGLVSFDATQHANRNLLDLVIAPYVSYGVKYIGLVSLDATRPANSAF